MSNFQDEPTYADDVIVGTGRGAIQLGKQLGSLLKSVGKSFEDYGVKGDYNPSTGTGTDSTTFFQNAINSTNPVLILPDGKYKVTSSILLKSKLTIIGIGNPVIYGVGVQEVFKTDSASTYNNIKLINVEIDAGKAQGDNNIRVCAQFYNVINLQIEKCTFRHASAGVGLDTCEDVWIDRGNLFEGMYQQTSGAAVSPGVYGYGVVVNESNNVYIEDNIIGSEKPVSDAAWVDRHAVYISNHGNALAINSARVFVRNNTIVMKSYNVDADMVTGFEYALKSIGGSLVEFKDNTILNGAGGVILSQRNLNAGRVVIEGNTFVDMLKRGVWITPDTEADPNAGTLIYDRVEVKGNYFKIKGEFAIGLAPKNVKELIVEDNLFWSTIADETKKSYCYYMYSDSVQGKFARFKGNHIRGFKQFGQISNVDFFEFDDYADDFPTIAENPFSYVASVTRREVKLNFVNNYYGFKKDTFTGLVGLKYFDRDLDMFIRCTQVSPSPIWVNEKGEQVVGTSSTRPNIATIRAGYKFWEQDLNRVVYYTGFDWSTSNTVIRTFGTKAEILAINAGGNYANTVIYNTDDKKPYFWNPVTAKWQDAAGTVLV